ncbi:MAG: hypothetical protein EZS28_011622, partial [Streblomastix strix]
SPDLNPIENFWGLVATNVYAGGRNFADAESLQEAIMDAVENFPQIENDRLCLSIEDRLFKVIETHGTTLDY